MKKLLSRGVALCKAGAKKVASTAMAAVAAVGVAATTMVNDALAAVDVAGVTTAITNAEASAHSVGTVVIGVVAGLAVVGIVIALVRKL